jgi:phosphoglycolate phosphatase
MRHTTCLLDLDGTLTDPFPGISRCIAHALSVMGLPVPEDSELRKWIGPPLKQSFKSYLDTVGDGDADRAVRLYRERFTSVGLYENSVYEGIPELLEKLGNQSIRLILATSKPSVYALRIIEHFGLDRWLDGVYGSELDGRRTDKVDLLSHLLKQQRLCPDECQMVGDREYDILAARYHGAGAIGVLWGYGTAVELLESGAETLVTSPAELAELFIGD